MAETRRDRVTLAALLNVLTPAQNLFITHRIGPHECEAVAEGTVEELRATRCVEVCGDNIVERLAVKMEGYPWDQDPVLVITIGGKAVQK